MNFINGQRYLQKIETNLVFGWTERLAKRKDMREIQPDFDEAKKVVAPTIAPVAEPNIDNALLQTLLQKIESLESKIVTLETPTPLGLLSSDTVNLDGALNKSDPDFETVELTSENLPPGEDGRVTKGFLVSQGKEAMQDYGKKVYGVKVSRSLTPENMADQILELQQNRNFTETEGPAETEIDG